MKKIIVAAVIGAVGAVFAEGEATFGGWRLSVGGNMAFGAKARMSYGRNAFGVVPGGAFDPATPGVARYEFDNGAYIDMSGDRGGARPGDTRNWQIPASMTRPVGDGRAFDFSNTQLGGGSVSDDGLTIGASLELSRTLYAAENGFGLDVAFGVAWMMCNDILNGSAQAGYGRTTSSFTPTEPGYPPSADGSQYGGSFGTGDMYFDPYDWIGPTPSSGTYSTHVSADYDEFELSLMLKPWYELTDWWRIYGNIGMGFGCGRFDFSMNAVLDGKAIYNLNEDECEWDFYGIAGGGTVFRLGSFDLSFDILYRFCQDDINVGNQYVNCTIEKPDLVLRLAIGYEF